MAIKQTTAMLMGEAT